jgi:aldehyde dehydrogenase (NAD+)
VAAEEGATLLTGGSRPEGLESGYFVEPTVFTADMARARSFVRDVEAGVVKVNGTTTDSQVQMPFGGMKASSTERQKEMGQRAYEFYTHEKAVYRSDP